MDPSQMHFVFGDATPSLKAARLTLRVSMSNLSKLTGNRGGWPSCKSLKSVLKSVSGPVKNDRQFELIREAPPLISLQATRASSKSYIAAPCCIRSDLRKRCIFSALLFPCFH